MGRKSSEIARTCPRRPCVFQTVGAASSGEPVEGEVDSKWTKSFSTSRAIGPPRF